jgi:hypothetical protein
MAEDNEEIVPNAKPSGTGCVECLASGAWWFHLRRCGTCGHIGCCDTSPNQHARKHFHHTKHAVIVSFEPGETWFYDFRTGASGDAPEHLAAPRWHPPSQPVPGPAGRVPSDWEEHLN